MKTNDASYRFNRHRFPAACSRATGLLLWLAMAFTARATQPPAPGEIETLRQRGLLPQRESQVRAWGNDRMADGLAARAANKILRARLQADGWSAAEAEALAPPPAPPPSRRGLPWTGAPKMLTVLVSFADYPAPANPTPANIALHTYGAGGAAYAPFESLNRYYFRASEGLLNIQGNVLPWHQMPGNRATYEPGGAVSDKQAIFNLLKAAMQANEATHDFAQYDNDNDGVIDVVNIIWTGPNTGWGSFWWGYRWDFSGLADAQSTTFGGKKANDFTWQWLGTRGSSGADYNPIVLVHETGHSLGLPDYYDYNGDVGPDGGVGGLDMMDANRGNHNAFSRWVLDWITPTVIGSGAPAARTLNAGGDTTKIGNKAVVIFPNATASPFGELFVIENRQRIGNDVAPYMPADGLLVWHVDGTLDGGGNNFVYDNSYTSRKLLRLMEADGLEQIEAGGFADAGDYYNAGETFGPATTPNSRRYDGADSGAFMDAISVNAAVMTASIGFSGVATVAKPAFTPPGGIFSAPTSVTISCATPGATIHFTTNGSPATAASPVYSGAPIPITVDTTLRARAFLSGYLDSVEASAQYTFGVSTPTISPPSGTYADPIPDVKILCATPGATIRYTLDGSTPTASSPIYGGGLAVVTATTVKARAFLAGYADSGVATATYAFVSADYLLDGVAKTGLSDAVRGMKYFRIIVPPGMARLNITTSGGSGDCDMYVRYGTVPFLDKWDLRPYRRGNAESVGIDLPAAGVWYVMLHGFKAYGGVTLLADYLPPAGAVAAPTFSPAGGTFYAPVQVAMGCATGGATIRYTTDGSDPTPGSPAYSRPVAIGATTTLKAAAFKSGWLGSAITSATYTITAPPVTTLTDGAAQNGLGGAAGSMQYFKIAVPAGRSKLDIKTSGGTGDCDMYVRFGASPSLSQWNFRPARKGNAETVTVKAPAAGEWFIMLHGFRAFSGVSLLADHY